MATVRTKLTPGTFTVRGKKVKLTAARAKHLADKFKSLKAAGVEFGVPWGHFEDAAPDRKEFLNTHFNAGYVQDVSVAADGGMVFTLDCPALKQGPDGKLIGMAELPDGRKVETAIKEVSPGIWDEWTDGQGVKHEDIIGHVALAMMPVIADQKGFSPAETKDLSFLSTIPSTAKITYFSSDIDELKEDVETVTSDEPEEEDLETILKPGDSAPNAEAERLTRVMALLAEGGMKLPPDTTCDNFLERLETAVSVLLEVQRKQSKPEEVTPQDPLVEEQPMGGTMLSTTYKRIKSDPTYRSLMAYEIERRRKTRTERIDALALRGVPPTVLDGLRGQKIFLSTILARDGSLTDDETDRQITLLESAMPEKEFAETFLSTLTPQLVEEHISPAEGAVTERVGNLEMSKEDAADVKARVQRVS